MKKFLLGKKIGMTQIINAEGEVAPVTVVQAGPCKVLDIITKEKRGYNAVLVGLQEVKIEDCNKPTQRAFKKLQVAPQKYLKEFRVENPTEYQKDQILSVDVFTDKDILNVRAKSIGKGFAGTIRRHNFHRGPMTHGSKSHRLPGSIGSGTTPGRVVKGKKMAGHLGNEYVTITNLKVVGLDVETNCIYVKGAVPGKKNGLVELYVK